MAGEISDGDMILDWSKETGDSMLEGLDSAGEVTLGSLVDILGGFGGFLRGG